MIKQVASIIRKRWYCLPSKSKTDQIRIKQQPDNQQVDGGFFWNKYLCICIVTRIHVKPAEHFPETMKVNQSKTHSSLSAKCCTAFAA